jgi:hypothetical protein
MKSYGLEEGAVAEVVSSTATVRLPVSIDSSLMRGVAYIPFNQPGVPSLGSELALEIRPV